MNYLLIYMRRIDCIYKLGLQEPGINNRDKITNSDPDIINSPCFE